MPAPSSLFYAIRFFFFKLCNHVKPIETTIMSSAARSATSALFVPLFESLLLGLICFTALHAFFASTVPSDYSPSTRSALLCSLCITIATCFMQLVVSAANKTQFIMAGTVSYKHALAIANANCCAAFLLLLIYLAPFLQAAAFPAQLSSSAEEEMQHASSYASFQRIDWTHAFIGASSSGWVFSKERNLYLPTATSITAVPIMGSIYAGIVLAYLTIMFLVSIYMSYVATPISVSSYLFMDPRFLVIATGFLGFGLGQMVSSVFASCTNPAGSIIGFSCFVTATCWFDLATMALLRTPRSRSLAKWAGLQILAIVPLFFLTSSSVPTTIKARYLYPLLLFLFSF